MTDPFTATGPCTITEANDRRRVSVPLLLSGMPVEAEARSDGLLFVRAVRAEPVFEGGRVGQRRSAETLFWVGVPEGLTLALAESDPRGYAECLATALNLVLLDQPLALANGTREELERLLGQIAVALAEEQAHMVTGLPFFSRLTPDTLYNADSLGGLCVEPLDPPSHRHDDFEPYHAACCAVRMLGRALRLWFKPTGWTRGDGAFAPVSLTVSGPRNDLERTVCLGPEADELSPDERVQLRYRLEDEQDARCEQAQIAAYQAVLAWLDTVRPAIGEAADKAAAALRLYAGHDDDLSDLAGAGDPSPYTEDELYEDKALD